VVALSENTFVHTSFLTLPDYGRVACNGMIYRNGDEAMVADSPADSTAAAALIGWIQQELGARITAVVANHFHDDCVGGLPAFHARGIPSYAAKQTLELADSIGNPRPRYGFDHELRLRVGDNYVTTRHFGAGHTLDNTVTYVEADAILFGGCFVKSQGAGKGNLADADTAAWPHSIGRVRAAYPRINYVIPGHGPVGGPELLDYTRQLFQP
jgi:metallo-beta-lactamase class B